MGIEKAIGLIECLVPLIVDVVKSIHPEKSHEEHKSITRELIDGHLKKEDENVVNERGE